MYTILRINNRTTSSTDHQKPGQDVTRLLQGQSALLWLACLTLYQESSKSIIGDRKLHSPLILRGLRVAGCAARVSTSIFTSRIYQEQAQLCREKAVSDVCRIVIRPYFQKAWAFIIYTYLLLRNQLFERVDAWICSYLYTVLSDRPTIPQWVVQIERRTGLLVRLNMQTVRLDKSAVLNIIQYMKKEYVGCCGVGGIYCTPYSITIE